jgi:hypothetical protein
MRVVDRVYSVQLGFDQPTLTITMTTVAKDALLGRMPPSEFAKELFGSDVEVLFQDLTGSETNDAHLDDIGLLRELLSALVRGAVGDLPNQERAGLLAEIVSNNSSHFRLLDRGYQKVVDYALAAPVLTSEQSWPSPRSLITMGAIGVGLTLGGIGLVQDKPALSDTAVVTMEAAALALTVENGKAVRSPAASSRAVGLIALDKEVAVIKRLPYIDEPEKDRLIVDLVRQRALGGESG